MSVTAVIHHSRLAFISAAVVFGCLVFQSEESLGQNQVELPDLGPIASELAPEQAWRLGQAWLRLFSSPDRNRRRPAAAGLFTFSVPSLDEPQ